MSMHGRIEELSSRHRNLDQAIHDEQKRAAAVQTRLQDLKRKKLKIK